VTRGGGPGECRALGLAVAALTVGAGALPMASALLHFAPLQVAPPLPLVSQTIARTSAGSTSAGSANGRIEPDAAPCEARPVFRDWRPSRRGVKWYRLTPRCRLPQRTYAKRLAQITTSSQTGEHLPKQTRLAFSAPSTAGHASRRTRSGPPWRLQSPAPRTSPGRRVRELRLGLYRQSGKPNASRAA